MKKNWIQAGAKNERGRRGGIWLPIMQLGNDFSTPCRPSSVRCKLSRILYSVFDTLLHSCDRDLGLGGIKTLVDA